MLMNFFYQSCRQHHIPNEGRLNDQKFLQGY
jgi:hypothetical protein